MPVQDKDPHLNKLKLAVSTRLGWLRICHSNLRCRPARTLHPRPVTAYHSATPTCGVGQHAPCASAGHCAILPQALPCTTIWYVRPAHFYIARLVHTVRPLNWHVRPAHFYIHRLVHIVQPFGTSGRPTSTTYTGWYILYSHLARPAGPLLHTPAGTYCTATFGTSAVLVLRTVLTELCEHRPCPRSLPRR
ncbi:hypothetical protein BDR03DRAFT_946942 [Suillus americanus]|nr:hypothetical protein BDR03DRAFT_946942 [Suillus americanus]